jgi:hypothetical protein
MEKDLPNNILITPEDGNQEWEKITNYLRKRKLRAYTTSTAIKTLKKLI